MIDIEKCKESALSKIDITQVEFGKVSSDHMFVAEYKNGEWQKARIVPFANLTLSPFALALHYAQSVFEGMKAFRTADGRTLVFRPDAHYDRLTQSMERMCMPIIPKQLFLEAVTTFVELEKSWIPPVDGGALYLRPLVFATEARVGVKVSEEYMFLVMASPSKPMYSKALSVKVETAYARAAEGGTGFVKCAGNYGAVFYPTVKAKEEGYDQVIWTDAKSHSYIEESGTMNVMVVKNGIILTPPVSGTILGGITRDSLLALAKEMNIAVEERKIGVSELMDGLSDGSVTEIFGTGTAAVVIPINEVGIAGKRYPVKGTNEVMKTLGERLAAIRSGVEKDIFGWNIFVN